MQKEPWQSTALSPGIDPEPSQGSTALSHGLSCLWPGFGSFTRCSAPAGVTFSAAAPRALLPGSSEGARTELQGGNEEHGTVWAFQELHLG